MKHVIFSTYFLCFIINLRVFLQFSLRCVLVLNIVYIKRVVDYVLWNDKGWTVTE